ncbi:DUF7857 domain-containing protein [Halorubrum aidingense]|nr:hypothetical protein [Halorubrum aidingense]
MDLTWTVERDGGVSLVRCRVHNDGAVRQRVRIESRLDGPVLPPRRSGIPEPGWDASGVTLELEPGGRRAIGFAVPAATDPSPSKDASPTSSTEPPVEVVDSTAVGSTATDSTAEEESGTAVAEALRDLADHRPPRAAVDGDAVVNSDGAAAERTDGDDTGEGDTTESDVNVSGAESDGDAEEQGRARTAIGSSESDTLDEWFDAIERRLERAERLTDADLATATAVVETAGGVEGVAALDARLTDDAERLRDLSERASSLAARAEATDAPIEALERLA